MLCHTPVPTPTHLTAAMHECRSANPSVVFTQPAHFFLVHSEDDAPSALLLCYNSGNAASQPGANLQ